MLMVLLLCSLFCVFQIVESTNDKGPGLWHVQYIQKCEEENHKIKVDLSQNKINRTHDGWNGHLSMEQDLGYGIGVTLELFKRVDGGFKLIQAISEPDFIPFCMKYAENSIKGFFNNAKINPPDFPIKAGEYDIKSYIMDYKEMATEGMYGEFYGHGCLISAGKEMFCIEVYADFTNDDDNGDDNDDDECDDC